MVAVCNIMLLGDNSLLGFFYSTFIHQLARIFFFQILIKSHVTISHSQTLNIKYIFFVAVAGVQGSRNTDSPHYPSFAASSYEEMPFDWIALLKKQTSLAYTEHKI